MTAQDYFCIPSGAVILEVGTIRPITAPQYPYALWACMMGGGRVYLGFADKKPPTRFERVLKWLDTRVHHGQHKGQHRRYDLETLYNYMARTRPAWWRRQANRLGYRLRRRFIGPTYGYVLKSDQLATLTSMMKERLLN